MKERRFGVLSFEYNKMVIRLRLNMDIMPKVNYQIKLYNMDVKQNVWTNAKGQEHLVIEGKVTNEEYQILKKLSK